MKLEKKILVVDDDTALAEMCKELLKSYGYDAEAAYSGKDALTKAKNSDYSIVISDLNMPEMNGLELLKKIKLLDNRIDVVIMSGYGTDMNAIKAKKLGATDFIAKPFERDELALIVNKILQTQSLEKEVDRSRSELELKHNFENTTLKRNIFKDIFYYSGYEYIYRKIKPAKEPRPLPTLPLWLFGVYIAFFLVASQRYENRVDIIENRAIGIFSQLGTSARKSALSRIATVQNYPCPVKPKILNPVSVFRSIFAKDFVYTEMVELLRKTIEDWKGKLKDVSLMNADLHEADLSKADLRGAILQGTNLKGADLKGADLRGADFHEADLRGAILQGANLEGANLQEADLRGANCFRANLKKANLKGINLQKANLQEANLSGAYFINTNLQGADLKGADLHETDLQGVNLRRADLRGADLHEANLQNAYLLGADFFRANLKGAKLMGADLAVAKFQKANLQEANLQTADLLGAEFQEANLKEANLKDAELKGAELEGSDLRGANLQDADLREANLQGAKLEGADLTDTINVINRKRISSTFKRKHL